MKNHIIGKYVICRGYYSGIFFGKVADASDDMKVIVLVESANFYNWKSEKGTGNINSAINSSIVEARFENTPGGTVILTENYSIFPCTEEQVSIVKKHIKDFS